MANTITIAPPFYFGSDNDDTILGSAAFDLILGLSGNDVIWSNEGNDDINGNRGDDIVSSGDGSDLARGGQDNDFVLGGTGNDWHLNGNIGDDTVYGEDGSDVLRGGQGNDTIFAYLDLSQNDGDPDAWKRVPTLDSDSLFGDLGNDFLVGFHGRGQDWLEGGKGNDVIYGSSGPDSIFAGEGRDLIDSGDGDDIVFGGDGDDLIYNSAGSDVLNGGLGMDTVYLAPNPADAGHGVGAADAGTDDGGRPEYSYIIDIVTEDGGAAYSYVIEQASLGIFILTDVSTGDRDILVNIQYVNFGGDGVSLVEDAFGKSYVVRNLDPAREPAPEPGRDWSTTVLRGFHTAVASVPGGSEERGNDNGLGIPPSDVPLIGLEGPPEFLPQAPTPSTVPSTKAELTSSGDVWWLI